MRIHGGHQPTDAIVCTPPVRNVVQFNSQRIRLAIESVWNRERVGAATVFGEPVVPIANGAVSSSCSVPDAPRSKTGTPHRTAATASRSTAITRPAATDELAIIPNDGRAAANDSAAACLGLTRS